MRAVGYFGISWHFHDVFCKRTFRDILCSDFRSPHHTDIGNSFVVYVTKDTADKNSRKFREAARKSVKPAGVEERPSIADVLFGLGLPCLARHLPQKAVISLASKHSCSSYIYWI